MRMGIGELLLILVIVVICVGPTQIPKLMKIWKQKKELLNDESTKQ